jgi:hypothetical protein
MKQTGVEWLEFEINRRGPKEDNPPEWLKELYQQAKEIEKQRMIDLVQRLKDYTRESHNVLGFDEREACEFVEIFTNQTFNSE